MQRSSSIADNNMQMPSLACKVRSTGKVAGKSPNTQWAFRQLWKKDGVELHQRDPSSVFMTVGDATHWHSQFFSTVAFQSHRLTKEHSCSI